MSIQQLAEAAAIEAYPLYPQDHELIAHMNWSMFIKQQRIAHADGYLSGHSSRDEEVNAIEAVAFYASRLIVWAETVESRPIGTIDGLKDALTKFNTAQSILAKHIK